MRVRGGDPGIRGQILGADPANRTVRIRVPWGWQQERNTLIAYPEDATFVLDGKPSNPSEALREDYWIKSVRARPQTVCVLTLAKATRPAMPFSDETRFGVVTNIDGLPRNQVVLAPPAGSGQADVEIEFSRVNPFVLDGEITTYDEVLKVGRRILCLGRGRPQWIIGVSEAPGDVLGTISGVDMPNRRIAVRPDAAPDAEPIVIELADDAVYLLDHRPASAADALVPGRTVTVLERREPRVEVRTEGTDTDH